MALDLTQRMDLAPVFLEPAPSVFVSGAFLADLPALRTLDAEGTLPASFPADHLKGETLNARLKRLITQQKVMIFMKGSPAQAACGFSQRLVDLLGQYDGLQYGHFDIYKDEEVREGLKKYSKWPTYPQVYVDGGLVGGIDICMEMHENGELEEVLRGG